INTNMELYLYSHEKDDHEQLTDMDRSLGNSLLTDVKYGGGEIVRVENGNYYFLVTEDYNVGLYKFTLKDGVEPVIQKEGSIDSFDIHDGKIVYAALRGLRPQELYIFDGEEKRLTDFNRLDLDLSEPEYFEVKSEDRKIDAWIMKPVDYDQGERYPTILEIHGCPKCVYGTVHFNEMQLLANSGYVVVFSNPSGSSGNGDDFADIMGEYGGPDFVDLMNVMDEALKRYDYIDEDRLGVTGGSYGGYMTNWVIGHTDRFSAAVSFRSISNWISKFGTTDIGYYFVKDQILADPWDDVEQLWDRSPMKYADRVDTPTLFITSRKDYRCWEAEAIQMFTSLKYHGVESKLVLFEDENHNLSREGKPKQRMKRLEEMLDWFDMYLK
ncbi:MAG: alpha/beta hydrolase family protein, partial [Candidatus Saliniplasma sp.]